MAKRKIVSKKNSKIHHIREVRGPATLCGLNWVDENCEKNSRKNKGKVVCKVCDKVLKILEKDLSKPDLCIQCLNPDHDGICSCGHNISMPNIPETKEDETLIDDKKRLDLISKSDHPNVERVLTLIEIIIGLR